MTTTIEHDPDAGCEGCPLERAIYACTAEDASDDDCPLRHGGVHVRAPLPAADHHEPAKGDAVRVDTVRTAYEEGYTRGHECAVASFVHVLDGEPRGAAETGEMARALDRVADLRGSLARLEDVEIGRAACCAEHESALRSIAIALGMSPDAPPGAVVERVEMMVRQRDQAVRDAQSPCRVCRARSDEESEEHETIGAIEAALGDACTGDLAADVRRVVEDRAVFIKANGSRIFELEEIRSILEAENGGECAPYESATEAACRAASERKELRARIAELERGTDQGEVDTLRTYLARAIRGCDRREQRAIEADMASDGLATEVV